MASFDIVSEIDWQEVDNAVNQAKKEIESRYDFKGSKSEIKFENKELSLLGDDEYKMGAMKDILQTKFHRRGVDFCRLHAGLRAIGGAGGDQRFCPGFAG